MIWQIYFDNEAARRIIRCFHRSAVQMNRAFGNSQTDRAAQQAVTVTTNQYKAGIVSYLNVIVSQAASLNNERTGIDILGRRMTASVLLIKALGGGWNASSLSGE